LAQHVVLTSDNPRFEQASDILSQMRLGLIDTNSPNVVVIEDRGQAIFHAVGHAQAQDVVLIAGKGHEQTQEIAGHRHPFSDVLEAQLALAQRGCT
jgi:UDP-N-acetylmuramoyl-L-alanyl-D-glutamate--2,6-diaminopimelate ligase